MIFHDFLALENIFMVLKQVKIEYNFFHNFSFVWNWIFNYTLKSWFQFFFEAFEYFLDFFH